MNYIGIQQVNASPHEQNGQPGYMVKDEVGKAYVWMHHDEFHNTFIPMGASTHSESVVNDNTITQEMVDDFIVDYEVSTFMEKTTVVKAVLRNGFTLIESSSCVDVANYCIKKGYEACKKRINDQVWYLLGFTLQWARSGIQSHLHKIPPK